MQLKLKEQDLPALAKHLAPFADLLFVAKAIAQIERPRCDAIQRRLLATGRYGGNGDPAAVYQLPDEAAKRFFADLDEAYREAGYKDLQPGYCPALIAEENERQAARALIEAANEFIPEISPSGLLCLGLEKYQGYIDLLCRLVVNQPGYKPSWKGEAK